MTGSIRYNFDDVHQHGATLKNHAAALEAEHQAILSDVTGAADFWGGAGSQGFTDFVTELNRNFAVIFAQLDEHGGKVQTVSANMLGRDTEIMHGWGV